MSLTSELAGISSRDPKLLPEVERIIAESGVGGTDGQAYLAALIRHGLYYRPSGHPSTPKQLRPPAARFVEQRALVCVRQAYRARDALLMRDLHGVVVTDAPPHH